MGVVSQFRKYMYLLMNNLRSIFESLTAITLLYIVERRPLPQKNPAKFGGIRVLFTIESGSVEAEAR